MHVSLNGCGTLGAHTVILEARGTALLQGLKETIRLVANNEAIFNNNHALSNALFYELFHELFFMQVQITYTYIINNSLGSPMCFVQICVCCNVGCMVSALLRTLQ